MSGKDDASALSRASRTTSIRSAKVVVEFDDGNTFTLEGSAPNKIELDDSQNQETQDTSITFEVPTNETDQSSATIEMDFEQKKPAFSLVLDGDTSGDISIDGSTKPIVDITSNPEPGVVLLTPRDEPEFTLHTNATNADINVQIQAPPPTSASHPSEPVKLHFDANDPKPDIKLEVNPNANTTLKVEHSQSNQINFTLNSEADVKVRLEKEPEQPSIDASAKHNFVASSQTAPSVSTPPPVQLEGSNSGVSLESSKGGATAQVKSNADVKAEAGKEDHAAEKKTDQQPASQQPASQQPASQQPAKTTDHSIHAPPPSTSDHKTHAHTAHRPHHHDETSKKKVKESSFVNAGKFVYTPDHRPEAPKVNSLVSKRFLRRVGHKKPASSGQAPTEKKKVSKQAKDDTLRSFDLSQHIEVRGEIVNETEWEDVSTYWDLSSYQEGGLALRKTFELLTRYLRGTASAIVDVDLKTGLTNSKWQNRVGSSVRVVKQDGVSYSPDLEVVIGDVTWIIVVYGHLPPAVDEEAKRQLVLAHEVKRLNEAHPKEYKIITYFVRPKQK
eukprot:TRINITY_DN142_c0_g2_i2.p1 TRINITY_DN142_c0_g2~~TRINITY_DN142_c0_g2_i2.p1  ORF type:complete len:558 (-),score=135.33 TRINITY_DN142_c0_g2_i2:32-1705(-)